MSPNPRHRIVTPWQLARLGGPAQVPAPADWIPATVPGGVQLDWARARGWPDLYYGQNYKACDGLEDSHWLYRTTVPAVELAAGDVLVFRCGGVDYQAELRVAGKVVRSSRGLEEACECDLTGAAPGTPVEILVFPAPKRPGRPDNQEQASHVTKPAVSYGWDWHPRLIPLGICGDTYFEVRPALHLQHVDFTYVLSDDLAVADVHVAVAASPTAAGYRWTLRDPAGRVVVDTAEPRARVEKPELWWTHDHGRPALYTLEVVLANGDRVTRRVGFRRVRLVMHAGAWDIDLGTPKSRNDPPVTFELNGRALFAKGSNWVCPDIFPGRINGDTYRPLLQLARDAHFNVLRCWGGAAAPREEFYEQCDELGLLVWQEFPLACNLYPDDPAYLAELDAESRRLIRRARSHPSLGLWCGGNELFNSWSRMTDQALPLRLLNRNCYELDPHTPFLPTSPVGGMGHGEYRFLANGREYFEIFQSARCTAYSEFGCPGASPVEYLQTFIPEAELWPPRAGTSWETHHGIKGWSPDENTWLCQDTLEKYFGPSASLEELVGRSTWLQTEGYKAAFEEARRQQPRCAMALNWCYNEPWPSAANNSIVNWPARPKPAYYAVQSACRPEAVSARIPKFQWRPGERFAAELWLLNDRPEVREGGRVEATLVCGAQRVPLGEWVFTSVPAQSAVRGPRLEAELPDAVTKEFWLELAVTPHAGWSSRYRLSLRA